MRGLYRLRRKLHYVVNVAFYGLFFLIGYLIGKGVFNVGIIKEITNLF